MINIIVVFVKKALPNEIIDVSIKKEKKHYNVGTINEIIEPSKNRIKSINIVIICWNQ